MQVCDAENMRELQRVVIGGTTVEVTSTEYEFGKLTRLNVQEVFEPGYFEDTSASFLRIEYFTGGVGYGKDELGRLRGEPHGDAWKRIKSVEHYE